jgi:DNA-binding CsgD family transcriptional regulator
MSADAASADEAGRGERDGPLRGRDELVAQLDADLLRLQAGTGSVLLLEGTAGLGKTRLLADVAATAEGRGVRVARGGADPVATLKPLGPLRDALASGPRPVLGREALQGLPDGPDGLFWTLQELQQALERAALDGPLLVVLDDLQWADAATLLALRTLPTRLSTHAIAWILAFRPDGDEAYVLEAMARLAGARAGRHRLAPLPPAAVAQVVEDVLGAPADDALLRWADAAQGRPLELLELLQGLRTEGLVRLEHGVARLRAGRVPTRFVDVTRARLARLSPGARRIVRVSSVLGHRFSADLLADLLDSTTPRLLLPLQEALDSTLLVADGDDLAFRHDLIREAVRDGLSPDEHDDLRRRAVRVLVQRRAPNVEVAEVLRHTARPGDLEAIGLLRRAAADLAPSDPASAARLSARALELLPPGSPDRGAAVGETAALLWQAGDRAGARRLADGSLGDGMPPEDEARIRLGVARVCGHESFFEAARQSALGAALPGISAPLRAELLASEGVNLAMVGDIHRTVDVVARALAAAREVGDGHAEAAGVVVESVVAFHRLQWDRALALAEEALAIARRAGLVAHALWMPYALWRCLLWAACGRIEEALAEADAGVRLAQSRGQASAMQLWGATRSRVLLDAGRLGDARTEAEATLAMVDELGSANFVDATASYAHGRVALLQGDREAIGMARVHAERLLLDPSCAVRRAGSWLAALIAHDAGDAASVRRLTLEAARVFDGIEPSLSTPMDAADVPVFVRLCLAAGMPERAGIAAATAVERSRRSPGFVVLEAGALHARGLLENDAGLLEQAVAAFGRLPRPLPRAGAHEDLALALAAASDRDGAVRHLDAALAILRDAGATGEAERVLRRLGELGAGRRAARAPGPREGWDALTPSELRVVGLVAEGRTNREVAQAVHLSPHTVGTHLRHAFAKLGISSRVELARVVADRR